MQQHVHSSDTQHGLVSIKAIKHRRVIALAHILVGLDGSAILVVNLAGCLHDESCTTHGRIANHIINLRLCHRDDHADDMARRTELTVLTFLRHARQHILIDIAHSVGIFHIQQVDIINHTLQHISLRNAENRILHIATIGRTTLLAYALNEHKHIVANMVEHILGREALEHRPSQVFVSHLLIGFRIQPLLAFLKQRVLEFVAKLNGVTLFMALLIVEQFDEEQIRKLFKYGYRHRDATSPQCIPNFIYTAFNVASNSR